MNPKRKKAEDWCCDFIADLVQNPALKKHNVDLYRKKFAGMNDKQFDEFIGRLEREEEILSIIVPNFTDKNLSVEHNVGLFKKYNIPLFERIWMKDDSNSPRYLTVPFMILSLITRRQAQLRLKKATIPKNTNVIDELTGQPTGPSKGSRISYPEMQVLAAMGLENSVVELSKYRGGDIKGFQMMESQIEKTGDVSLNELLKIPTNVRSTETLHVFLTGAHLDNTLLKG